MQMVEAEDYALALVDEIEQPAIPGTD